MGDVGGTALKPSSAVDRPCATRSDHAVYTCAKRSTHPWCTPENRSEAPRSPRGRTAEHFLLPCKIAWVLHEAHAWKLQWCSARRRNRDLHIKYLQQHHLGSARTLKDAVYSRAASALGAPRMDMHKALGLASNGDQTRCRPWLGSVGSAMYVSVCMRLTIARVPSVRRKARQGARCKKYAVRFGQHQCRFSVQRPTFVTDRPSSR